MSVEKPDFAALYKKHRDRAKAIDLMPVDVDTSQHHQRKSMFQERRRAQMDFLMEIWPLFFPDHPNNPTLQPREARRLMKVGVDDVEEVLEVVALVAEYQYKGRGVVRGIKDGKEIRTKEAIEHPISYIIKTIKREQKWERGETSNEQPPAKTEKAPYRPRPDGLRTETPEERAERLRIANKFKYLFEHRGS